MTRPPNKTWKVGTLTYTTGGLIVLFIWLLWGDFAWSIKDRSIGAVMSVLLKKYGASDLLNGIFMSSIPPLISIVLGPIVSYRSDRYRSKWGRRIPYLLIPTPIAALAMISLGFSPFIGRELHSLLGNYSPGMNNCILFLFGFFWVIFDISMTIANSVFGGLINDVVPVEVIGRFFGAFRAISLFVGILFFFYVINWSETYYLEIFLTVGVLFGAGFALMCIKVKEGEYPPPPPPSTQTGVSGFLDAAKTFFIECFGKPYYLWVFAALAVGTICSTPVNLFSYFYSNSLSISLQTYGDFIGVTYICSLILAYPLGVLADRFHPLHVGIIVIFLYALNMILGGLFIHNVWTFGVAFIAHGVLSGTYFTTTAALGQKLLPRARFAEYASAAAIIASICSIISGPLIGYFLDQTNHNYRYTFYIAFGLSVLGLGVLLVLNRQFMALGGPKNYIAPE